MTCKTHPDAPHGFVRGASHSEDRYVCECEFWEEPKMNERIRELAEQAGFHSSAIIDLGTGTGVEVWHKYDIENDQEHFPTDEMMTKFAELIVRECGVALRPMLRDMVSRGKAYDLIKEHFGVEE